jgi:hypothetical protein
MNFNNNQSKIAIIYLFSVYLILAVCKANELKLSSSLSSFSNGSHRNRFNRIKLDRNKKKSPLSSSSSSIQSESYFSSFISNKNNKSPISLNRKFNSFTLGDDATNNNNRFRLDCPIECTCTGLSIDCSYRELKQVPKNIPKEVIKV